ncbi:MAG: hypothetical protein AAGA56_10300 [Myxococcota bacterium]
MRFKRLALLLGGALLVGCVPPELEALTSPPPGTQAEVNQASSLITLTEGTAIALRCNEDGEPCLLGEVTTNEPTVASVKLSYSNQLVSWYRSGGLLSQSGQIQEDESLLVVIAHRPGESALTFADTVYTIRVVPQ